MPILRPGAQPFKPPTGPVCSVPLEVDFTTSEDIDAWFRDYVLSSPCKCKEKQTEYYFVTNDDVYNFPAALRDDTLVGVKFKTGDYLIVSNRIKSKYSVYLYTTGGWISFRGKDAFDVEEGDVDIIQDDDDPIVPPSSTPGTGGSGGSTSTPTDSVFIKPPSLPRPNEDDIEVKIVIDEDD